MIVCLIVAVWVVWPRRRWGREMMDRIDYLNKGSARKEAVALLRMLESQRALNERKGRRLRWGSIPLVIAVAAVVGQAFFAWKASLIDRGGCISEGATPRSRRTPRSPARRPGGAGAAARAAGLHPSAGALGPLRPDDFIGASRLVWNSPRIDDEPSAAA